MSLNAVNNSLQGSLANSSRSIAFQSDADFNAKLTLGEIIKGKVMRQYENGRYGVSFKGQERVVDSTFPLKTGEVILGKVVALDEKVHLQRVFQSTQADSSFQSHSQLLSGVDTDVLALMERYNVSFSATELKTYKEFFQNNLNTKISPFTLVIVKKLSLPFHATVLNSVNQFLTQNAAHLKHLNTGVGPVLSFDAQSNMEDLSPQLQGLAIALKTIVEKTINKQFSTDALSSERKAKSEQPMNEASGNNIDEQDSNRRDSRLGDWLLNVQHGGAVNHRVFRLPIWFGEQMIEMDMAMFSETNLQKDSNKNANEHEDLKYRKAVISLETEQLGHVEMVLNVVQRHLKLTFKTDNTKNAEFLADHLSELTNGLQTYGWIVSDVEYLGECNGNGVRDAVVEHHISQGSLNQLL